MNMEEKTEEELLEYLADLLVDIFFEREETEKKKNASTPYMQQLISVVLLEEDFEHVTYLNAEDSKSFTVSLYDPTRRSPEASRKLVVQTITKALWDSGWSIKEKVSYRLGVLNVKLSRNQ